MPNFGGARGALVRASSAGYSGAPFVWAGGDPGQDVDDASLIALATVLHNRGLIKLIGYDTAPQNDQAPSFARLMLDYAGLWSVPVAARKANDVGQSDYMNAGTTAFYGYTATRSAYPDPVPAMRQAFAACPDKSVIIVETGPIPNLYDLLQSPADAIDPRTGKDLVRAKVQRVILQGGGVYGTGATVTFSGDFNWSFVPTSVNPVFQTLQSLGVEVWLAEGRWGQDDAFAGPLLSSASASNPLKKAHDFFQTNNSPSIRDTATRRTRASWDPVALLASLGLSDRFTLAAGTMFFDQPNNNTQTWTRNDAGNCKYLVPVRPVSSIMTDLNALYDAYDQGQTAPAKPTFTVVEAVQGTVILTPAPQFFTTWNYTLDNGATWTALPANGVLSGLSAATLYGAKLQGTRYGLTSPTSDAVAFTTKAVVTPTSIENVPGVIRDFDFRTTAGMLPASPPPSSTVKVTSVADKTGSAYPLAPDGTQGPIFIASSVFGANRGALRSVNGDANNGAFGGYARLFGDLPELASKSDYAMFFTMSVNNDRNDNGRVISFANAGNADYNSSGFTLQIPTANRLSFQLYGNGVAGGQAAMAHDTPYLAAAIVTAGSAQLWVNGVAIGSPVTIGTLGAATPKLGLFRAMFQDASCVFGDMAGFVVLATSPTTANRQYVEGKMAWNATGDGSLLPTGHPYKTVSPDAAAAGPALTATSASFAVGAAAGTSVSTLGGFASGETGSSVSPNDGRVVLNAGGTALVIGMTASSAGTTNYTVTTSTGRTIVVPVTVTAAVATPTGFYLPAAAPTVNGKRVNPVFTGVNVQGMDSGSRNASHTSDVEGNQFSTPSKADLQYLADRGVTAIRLPLMPERLFLSMGSVINETFATVVERVLTDANSVGIAVIIEMHGYAQFYAGGTQYWFGGGQVTNGGPPATNYTVAQFADQCQKIAIRFRGVAGLGGYDYNEPQGVPGDNTLLASYMSAYYDAITNPSKGNDQAHWVYIPGNNYTNAENFATLNPSYPISDPYDLMVYTGHMYMDPNSNGDTSQFPTWASCVAAGSTSTTGANRIKAFGDCCASKGVRGNIGEVGLYSETSAALDADFNALQQAKTSGLSTFAWHYGPTFGADGIALYPYAGTERAAWGPIQQVNKPSTTYKIGSVDRAVAGQASAAIPVSYTGKLSTPLTVTGHSTGYSTFGGTAVLPANVWNPTGSFTATDAAAEEVKITTTNDSGFTNPAGFYLSTTATIPGGNDNLILTQRITNPSWSKQGSITISDYVDPADGVTYSRVKMTGDYHSLLLYATGTHASGYMQVEIKTLSVDIGSGNQYIGFYGGSNNDLNFGQDNSKPLNTWTLCSVISNANADFRLHNRGGPTDFLIRKMKENPGSQTAYAA